MNAYESIYKKMEPIKTYNQNLDTNLSFEISAYAYALDEHRKKLDEFLRECFITTACSYGLENKEKLVGDVKEDYPLEKRRQMLILRNTLGEKDFTREGIGRFLSCFGVTEYDIIELPQELAISIYIKGDYSTAEKVWLEKQIQMMMPAHLISTVTFQGIFWQEIDENTLTFQEMDNRNYTWNYINNLT